MKYTSSVIFLLLAEKEELSNLLKAVVTVRMANGAEFYRCMVCAFNIVALGPHDCCERKFKRNKLRGIQTAYIFHEYFYSTPAATNQH